MTFFGIGFLTALLYAAALAVYQLDLLSGKIAGEIFNWVLLLGLLYAYWQGAIHPAVAQEKGRARVVVGFAILFCGLALFIPPFHSMDLFGYINRGWQQAAYDINPYVTVVSEMPTLGRDPMLAYHWIDNPSPYGFLYMLWAKALCWIGGGYREFTLLVFKGSNVLLHFAIAGLLYLGVRKGNQLYQWDIPERQTLYLYLWNPLLILHHIANGHNDLAMAAFVVLAVTLAIYDRWVWVLPSLLAATLMKYAAVVTLPFAVLFFLKNRPRHPLRTLVTSIVLSGALFLWVSGPFLLDWQSFQFEKIVANAGVPTGSIHAFFYHAVKSLHIGIDPEVLKAGLTWGLRGLFLAIVGVRFYRLIRRPHFSTEQWILEVVLAQALLICFVSPKFYPWYLGMFLGAGLFLRAENPLRQWLVLLSCFQLLAFTFVGQAHMLNFVVMTALPTVWVFGRAKGHQAITESNAGLTPHLG
ncbi:MAG: hypothetical protein KTR14_10980 [Vampirovibrio sp.]|nr:hypothetical protein [Vampirovibrio sp.]